MEEILLWSLKENKFENECDACCVTCKQLCESRCTNHTDKIDCDVCKYDDYEEVQLENTERNIYDINMRFDTDVLAIWHEICRNFNMDRLLLNYVEQNEFKLCIERGLKLIK